MEETVEMQVAAYHAETHRTRVWGGVGGEGVLVKDECSSRATAAEIDAFGIHVVVEASPTDVETPE